MNRDFFSIISTFFYGFHSGCCKVAVDLFSMNIMLGCLDRRTINRKEVYPWITFALDNNPSKDDL